jgi:hypothetical protein
MVSSTHCTLGPMVAMMHVLVLPPSESRSSRVSLESLHHEAAERTRILSSAAMGSDVTLAPHGGVTCILYTLLRFTHALLLHRIAAYSRSVLPCPVLALLVSAAMQTGGAVKPHTCMARGQSAPPAL